jgi:hypothetical protein
MALAMRNSESAGAGTRLEGRRFLVCGICGWVHYAMTAEEKAAQDRTLERYQLDWSERRTYESAYRQCLRCESPVEAFRTAGERDLNRAAGHIVTPVLFDE